MQYIDGKAIYSEVNEILEPSHTALVVWDVQNLLVNSIFDKAEFIKNINFLIESARKSNIAIFYTSIEILPLKYESSARLYIYTKLFASHQKSMPTPPEKRDLSLAITRNEDEILITKHTASIFIGTDFERMMRNSGITTIIFSGISTELGIESSARDALNRDFYPVIVSDAVSSSDKDAHTRSLQNMERFLTVISIKELAGIWSRYQRLE
jgi:nicotinamidase-related amidase